MEKKTLVDDPNGLGFGYICSSADLCSGVGDFAIHLHVVLILLIFLLFPYSFSISSDGGRFIWVS